MLLVVISGCRSDLPRAYSVTWVGSAAAPVLPYVVPHALGKEISRSQLYSIAIDSVVADGTIISPTIMTKTFYNTLIPEFQFDRVKSDFYVVIGWPSGLRETALDQASRVWHILGVNDQTEQDGYHRDFAIPEAT